MSKKNEGAWPPDEDFQYRVAMFKAEVKDLLGKYYLKFNHLVYMDGIWEGSDDLIIQDRKFHGDSQTNPPRWCYYEIDWKLKDAVKRYRDEE